MKKLAFMLALMLILSMLPFGALAAGEEPQIIMEPQSPHYTKYSTAEYTVKATGSNLTATWYLEYNGKTHNLSDNTNGIEPWEGYAGETYGGVKVDNNTFTWFFGGIEEELSGSKIWCVIEDGHYDVTSQKAMITVQGTQDPPTITAFPAEVTAGQREPTQLICEAASPDGSKLTFHWYETTTGKLQDIKIIDPNADGSNIWTLDTGKTGTRYYVCMVQTANGGIAYSSVVPVTVTAKAQVPAAPQIKTDRLPQAEAGSAYNAQISCSDRNAKFTVSYNPGKANDFDKTGLILSQDGKITGTPKTPGSYSFCICAAGEGGEDYMVYTLVVKEKAAVPTEPAKETEQATEPVKETIQTTEPAETTAQLSEPTEENTEATDPTEETKGLTFGAGVPGEIGPGVQAAVIALVCLVMTGAGVAVAILLGKKKS